MYSVYIYIVLYVVCVIVQGNSKLTILVRTGPIIQNMFERFLLLLFFIFAPCRDPCLRLPGLRCRVSEPKRCHVSAAACPQAVGNATSRHPSVLDAMFPEQGFGFGFPVVLGCVSFAWISAGRAVRRKFSACLEHHTSVGRCHVHMIWDLQVPKWGPHGLSISSQPVHKTSLYASIYLSIHLSIYLYLSFYLSIYPSIYLSI